MTDPTTKDILKFYTDDQIGAEIDHLARQKNDLRRKLLQATTKMMLLAQKHPEELEDLRAWWKDCHAWLDQDCPPLPVPLE